MNIRNSIENIKGTRTALLESIADLSIEQINKIPEGFNNNIIWNVAHLAATQQRLLYVLSDLDIVIEDRYFSPFIRGTKPEKFIAEEEFEQIKTVMTSSLDQLLSDYEQGIFKTYQTFKTPYHVEITTIEEAIQFLPYHEGMHKGYILALCHLV
ncbi:DinB family protein [Pedobacter sp. AW1-32]|uniref:DinB family protein n=1 Tax=Pedobacter sp. AW1-32 TaxID=3383026 RepID=UPI003FEE38B6